MTGTGDWNQEVSSFLCVSATTLTSFLVRFYCSLTYDPFRFMAIAKKVYGFVITIVETPNTIPTLFSTLQNYRIEAGLTPGPAMWDFLTTKKKDKEEYSE